MAVLTNSTEERHKHRRAEAKAEEDHKHHPNNSTPEEAVTTPPHHPTQPQIQYHALYRSESRSMPATTQSAPIAIAAQISVTL